MLEYSSFLHHYSVQFHHNNNFDNKTQFGRCSFRTTKVLFQIWPEGNVKYLATVHGLDAKWRWWRPESSFTQSRADIVYQFTVIGCSTETQQWSPAGTNNNHAPTRSMHWIYFFALKCDLIFCMPLVHSNSSWPCVFMLDRIFENFSSGVFPQFISYGCLPALVAGGKLHLLLTLFILF